jgi:ADP-heptose:LPS heptosyltransferase
VLLSLEDVLREKEIDLYSHTRSAPDILRPFGVRVSFHPFTAPERTSVRPRGRELPRRPYPRFEIPAASLERGRRRARKARVVGIHPIGSDFSEQVLAERNRAPKRLPVELVDALVAGMDDGDTSFFLFCAPEERHFYPIRRPALTIVAEEDVWDALASVPVCHLVIGVDSVIKTMAALLGIPTLVLLGEHRDRFRDRVFIRPYVGDGVMRVLRFREAANLSAEGIRAAAEALATGSRMDTPSAC